MDISDAKILEKSNNFRSIYSDEDDALNYLFQERMTNNKDIKEVLVKVTALNELYSTQLTTGSIKEIAKLITNNKELDDLLAQGDKKAVDYIGRTKEGMNNAYVFASKYCSFHYPDKYPIFDSYSWSALSDISDNNLCNRLIL